MSWRQEQINMETGLDGIAWSTPAGPSGTTRTGTVYTSWQKVREWQLYIPEPTTASDLVNSIFDVISEGVKTQLLEYWKELEKNKKN